MPLQPLCAHISCSIIGAPQQAADGPMKFLVVLQPVLLILIGVVARRWVGGGVDSVPHMEHWFTPAKIFFSWLCDINAKKLILE